jgi:thiamine-monophosphate kinase
MFGGGCPILNNMRRKAGAMANPNRGELALIERIRGRAARSSKSGLTLGIGDDCALLRLKAGEEAAVTTDLSIEGRHFRLDLHPPEAVGHRTLARGLSDIAAMGARPVAAFLSLGLPAELAEPTGRKRGAWVDRFLDGFLSLAAQHKTPLAGGDLAQSPVALADIILIGAVPSGRALLRSGARAGDLLYVTGCLGGSASGLRRLRQGGRNGKGVVAAHLWPEPRIAQGVWLRNRGAASAAIDISDGLSTDLHHLCEESGVAAEIDSAALPNCPGASLEDALHGGEDYELLFTAGPTTRIPKEIAGVAVTCIGAIVKSRASGQRVTLMDGARCQALPARGWEHFRT